MGNLEPEKFLPKIVVESWVSVKDNRVRHVMKLEDIIHKKLSCGGSSERMLKSTKMSIFGNKINNHHDEGFIS